MRVPILCGAAMLSAVLMIGCGADSGPTAENAAGLTSDATSPNTSDHFTTVETVTFEVESPCNGELIVFSGQSTSQLTAVDTREHLDDGFWLHMEMLQRTQATGTGSESGATYTINDIFHETFESPNPPAPHATFSEHAITHVTSSVVGLSFDVHFMFYVTFPSSKDAKVTRDVENVVCS